MGIMHAKSLTAIRYIAYIHPFDGLEPGVLKRVFNMYEYQ